MVVRASIVAKEQPALSFEWEPIIGSFPSWGADAKLTEYDIQEVDIPFLAFEQQSIYLEGVRQAFAGSADAMSFTLGIHMFQNPRALRWLLSWQQTVRSRAGFYGLPIHYQRNLKFALTDPTGRQIMIAVLKNCWPVSPSPLALSKSVSEPLMLQVQFSAKNVDYEDVAQ